MKEITENDLIYKVLELIEMKIKFNPNQNNIEGVNTTILIDKIFSIMNNNGDVYNVNQGGAVGPNSSAQNNTFTQNNLNLGDDYNFEALLEELQKLKKAMKSNAENPDEFTSVTEIAYAEVAAENKEGNKVVQHLLKAGKFALQTAKDVGVELVASIIAKHTGIG